MNEQETKRISSLPRFLTCPPSGVAAEFPYSPESDVAAMGTAAHEALALMVGGQDPDLGAVAAKHLVNRDEMTTLYHYGCAAWAGMMTHFPSARSEVPLVGDGISGTADVFHQDGMTMCVADWKSGRVKRDHRAQLVGYAAAAVHEYGMPESGEVKIFTVWLRHFEYDVATVTADDIERLYHDIKSAGLDVGTRYAPGEACTYCPRQMECGARREFMGAASAALSVVGSVDISPGLLARLHGRAKALRSALVQYDTALKLALAAGPLSDGCGNMLSLGTATRDQVHAREAWPVLQAAGFTDEEIAGCVKMTKGGIMKVVGDKTAKGKGRAKVEFLGRLKDAGAVTQKMHQEIKLTKGGQQ